MKLRFKLPFLSLLMGPSPSLWYSANADIVDFIQNLNSRLGIEIKILATKVFEIITR